ncbi:MAG: dephospho-CoA kinase, partial [Candidatus Nanopelagicales bacterium]
LREDESLDRAALAGIVFTDPSQRAKLDAITHPRITALTQERFAMAPPGSVVVHDLALLTELGLQGGYDHVVVVDCPDEIRVERLLDRGLTEADARARIAAQASRQDRLAIADTVLDNSGTLADLTRQVEQLWTSLLVQARSQGSSD